eukprot:162149-Pelagomonas_calceolata.AAC.1
MFASSSRNIKCFICLVTLGYSEPNGRGKAPVGVFRYEFSALATLTVTTVKEKREVCAGLRPHALREEPLTKVRGLTRRPST